MTVVRVKAMVVEDNSGVRSHTPILLTEEGELEVATEYMLKLEVEGASQSSMIGALQAIALMLDYMEANKNLFKDPELLFQTFAKRLYTGTIGPDGLDPSGLYWIPTATENVNKHISRLTKFSNWLTKKYDVIPINPLREATPHEQRLNYAAWFRKNQTDFLGHIEYEGLNETTRRARTLKGRVPLKIAEDDAIAFPQKYWERFFLKGIGGAKDPRVALRDKLVTILMHGGGLRESEALTLWVTDVLEDPNDPDVAIVRIYNEKDGKAPENWRSRKGTQTRAAYLHEKYRRIPRNKMIGTTAHLGWKCSVVDNAEGYIQVQWFEPDYGRLFMMLWKTYQRYRATTDCHHPYAFISFYRTSLGDPYTLNAFRQSYNAGLKRIGLSPCKAEGIGAHGHRHSYGRRLENAGLDAKIIMRCLHHSALESQGRYTGKSQQEVSEALNNATAQLENPKSKIKTMDWKALIEYGFEDIDPQSYFTGKHPKLGRTK